MRGDRNVLTAYCLCSSADGSLKKLARVITIILETPWRVTIAMFLVQHYISHWSAVIGAFQSGYCFGLPYFPLALVPCFLIVGMHASGISMPLSLLMLLGLSLM